MSSRARANVTNYAAVKAALVKQAANAVQVSTPPAAPAAPAAAPQLPVVWAPSPTLQQRLAAVEKTVGNTEQLQGSLLAVVSALEKIEKIQDRLVSLEKVSANIDQLNRRLVALEMSKI